jgi:hypothetical protein
MADITIGSWMGILSVRAKNSVVILFFYHALSRHFSRGEEYSQQVNDNSNYIEFFYGFKNSPMYLPKK